MLLSPDGKTLASGGGCFDGTIRLWDISTGENITTLTEHTEVYSLSFSPDGKTLVSGGGCFDGTIRLWDVSTGTLFRTLTGHTETNIRVSFSPDGNTISSESPDGTLLLWELNPTRTALKLLTADVNEDGIVNVDDVFMVVSALGQVKPENPRLDVNGDGDVDKHDLISVALHLDEETTPQAAPRNFIHANTTAQKVQHALDILKHANDGSPAWQHAIAKLEQLAALLIPEKTKLLPNYPNPFNPETWIPYQLAKPHEVTLAIYAADGKVVRKLPLGHQTAGIYQHKNKAAHWDGKNEIGEPVASGVYFYTLTAGNFTATRKMLIWK